jgi:hypothetical protein
MQTIQKFAAWDTFDCDTTESYLALMITENCDLREDMTVGRNIVHDHPHFCGTEEIITALSGDFEWTIEEWLLEGLEAEGILDELRQDDISFILETSEAVTWDVTIGHYSMDGSFRVTAEVR